MTRPRRAIALRIYNRRGDAHQRGTILIVALLVMVVLASLVLVYARSMRVELQASANRLSSAQAMAVAQGAVEAVMLLDDAAPVESVTVGEGRFWILSPTFDDDAAYGFELVDEAGKLNLNTATAEMLSKLPGMDVDLAEAIVAWRGDGEGDSSYYLSLSDPYEIKGEPFETVEELLLVRGITPVVLYGEDANRNGVLDPNEDDGDETDPPDNGDGILDHGLFHFVTVYSMEPAPAAAEGESLVNVNNAGQGALRQALSNFVENDQEIATAIRTRRPHANLIDLFYKSTMEIEQFIPFEPRVTFGGRRPSAGKVNINTASHVVLAALPELTEADADALIEHRQKLSDQGNSDLLRSVVWVTQVLDQEKAVAIGNFVTTASYQRSADIVAMSAGGRTFERIRIVYDTMGDRPRLLASHRLTHLGWPLAAELRQPSDASTYVSSQPGLSY